MLRSADIYKNLFASTCLLLIVVLGLLRVLEPFHGDNSLFLVGAKLLNEGQIYYQDFWDIKQPGIFYFFLFGGRLFGFDAIGIHVFEVLYWTLGSLLLMYLLRDAFRHTWLSPLVPAFFLISYFAYGTLQDTTQLEILVNLPILLSVSLIVFAEGRQTEFWLLYLCAGLLAGITVLFKLALAPIFIGFAVVALFDHWRSHRTEPVFSILLSYIGRWAFFAVGVIAVLLSFVVHSWGEGTLGLMLWSSFIAPGEMMANGDLAPLGRLFHSSLKYVAANAMWAPFLVAAFVLAGTDVHNRWTRYMVAWLVMGFFVIVIQRFSWWGYHFLTLYAPAAFLAVQGVDKILIFAEKVFRIRLGHKLVLVAIFLLPVIGALAPVSLTRLTAFNDVVIKGKTPLETHLSTTYPHYAALVDAAKIVRPAANDKKIYVMGDPTMYELLSAKQAVALHGWALEYATPEQFSQLRKDLEKAAPQFVFMDLFYSKLLKTRSPALLSLLDSTYKKIGESEIGVWYGLK